MAQNGNQAALFLAYTARVSAAFALRKELVFAGVIMSKKGRGAAAPFSVEQMVTYARSLMHLNRSIVQQDPRAGVTVESFTVKLDGSDWFVVLHGWQHGDKMVMFCRCEDITKLGSTIQGALSAGKWGLDRFYRHNPKP